LESGVYKRRQLLGVFAEIESDRSAGVRAVGEQQL